MIAPCRETADAAIPHNTDGNTIRQNLTQQPRGFAPILVRFRKVVASVALALEVVPI